MFKSKRTLLEMTLVITDSYVTVFAPESYVNQVLATTLTHVIQKQGRGKYKPGVYRVSLETRLGIPRKFIFKKF